MPDDAGKKIGGACQRKACRSVRLLGAWRGQLTLGSPSRSTRQCKHVLGRRRGRGTTGIAIPGHDECRMKTYSAEREKAPQYRAGPVCSCRKGRLLLLVGSGNAQAAATRMPSGPGPGCWLRCCSQQTVLDVTLWPRSAEPVAHIPSPTTCTAARAASWRVRGAKQTLGVGYSWLYSFHSDFILSGPRRIIKAHYILS